MGYEVVDEMPIWEKISLDPEVAAVLQSVADTLTATKGQTAENRAKVFRNLVTDWHPDRHVAKSVGTATKVFQWLQEVKSWYLDSARQELENQPLQDAVPDRPVPPENATQYLHPSGSV